MVIDLIYGLRVKGVCGCLYTSLTIKLEGYYCRNNFVVCSSHLGPYPSASPSKLHYENLNRFSYVWIISGLSVGSVLCYLLFVFC
jgi:hypothetical protein